MSLHRPLPRIHRPLGPASPAEATLLLSPAPVSVVANAANPYVIAWEARRIEGASGWMLTLLGEEAARVFLGEPEGGDPAPHWFQDRPALEESLTQLEASGQLQDLASRALSRADGEERWVCDALVRQPGGFRVLSWDITEQRRAMVAKGRLERSLTQVLGSVGGVLWRASKEEAPTLLAPESVAVAQGLVDLGASEESDYGCAWEQAVHPDDRERVTLRRREAQSARRDSLRQTYRVVDRLGALHWIQEDLHADGDGRLRAFCVDVTERRRTDELLRHALVASRCLVWHAEIAPWAGEWRWTLHMNLPDIALECFQVPQAAGESYAQSWRRAIFPEDVAGMEKARVEALQRETAAFQVDYRVRDRRGIVRTLREEVRLLRTGAETFSAIGIVTDQSVQQKALAELRASREEYRALFEHVPIGIYRLSAEGQFVMANPALLLMLGFDADEDPQALEWSLAERDRSSFLERLTREGAVRGWESGWRRKDGSDIVVRENAKAVHGPDGAIQCFEGTVEDITERRRVAERMEWQATHDALTGLPNRTFFLEALQGALAEAKARQRQVGVFFVDLDKFKQINDLLGHGTGDKLLPIIAERLRSVVRESDTVARMGGDEFTLLLPDLKDTAIARRLAQGVREAIAAPIEIDNRKFEIAVSVGAVIYPRDGEDAETLLRHADIAMYRAKGQGGNDISFFAASMHEEMRERVTLEGDLRQAITRKELVLHYQPQVSITSHRVVGVEALVRWQHPERGLLPPAQFIPLAEETGLIIPLGEWVLKEACKQGAQWLAAGVPLRMSVNMSPKQLLHSDYPSLVDATLKETLFDPRLLEIELTESAILENGSRVESAMGAIKELGVGLQMDDFGTGYSSLALLRRYPMDVLKIDRGFVAGVATSAEDAAIVRSVVELAHTLGMMVIAEGVETPAQFSLLEELGCDIVQGYLTGGPVPAEALLGSVAQIGGIAIPSRRAA